MGVVMRFYIWGWVDSVSGETYLIGKGKEGSGTQHRKRKNNEPPRPEHEFRKILEWFDTEQECLEKLNSLIWEMGFHKCVVPTDEGLLHNHPHLKSATQLRRGERARGAVHPLAKPCVVYDIQGNEIARFESQGQCAHHMGLAKSTVKDMVMGRVWQSAGFCVRPVGVKWTPTGRRVTRLGPIVGYSPSGERKVFKNQSKAAEFICGDKRSNSYILRSLRSPSDNKIASLGWYFFLEGDEVEYSSIIPRNSKPEVG